MDTQNNLLVKFADDITTSAPVKSGSDSAEAEVESVQNWSDANQMTLNLSKTWEMVVHGGSMKPLPAPIVGIERKSWLKLLGVTFQENPCCWDLHIDDLLTKASGQKNYKDKLETETDEERLKVFRGAKDLVESLIDEARIVPESEEGKRKFREIIRDNVRVGFEKFRAWANENLEIVSSIVISIAGIITTVVVAGKGAVAASWQD
ncbi:Hypothetical predicted protein [Paramuricea clavata]|uniref:Uncharacterized protein n=1 Tax=Paramuricea clavata TaxID=317549 RepID=A0A6S7JLD1_PARCT|nr:Hypothetical predicted protein [Paramuricea clavata]